MSVVGIDLGTTNTVVACVRAGKVHVLADEHGQRLLPSVVSFHPNGEVLVGGAARARRVIDPRNTVYSHKRLIGRSWGSPEIVQAKQRFAFDLREGPGQGPLVHARGHDYTLPEMSAFVLKRARQIAETATGAPVERAVITVPAHFNELQRASTKVAGRVSGLEVLRILNEPTAAALAYGLGRTGNERVAVYDFGGGTFDCTLLDLSGNVFEVLATAGDSFLGGDDVDTLIADRMAESFLKAHRIDPRTDVTMLERLRTSAEEIKVQLSTAETHTVVLKDVAHGLGGSSIHFTFTMSRRDLEAAVAPLVDRTFKVTQDALSLARLTPTGFDKVILVGGSTRMPLVRRRVEAFFGTAPLDRVNPDEVVAIGAAIQAAALTEGQRRKSIPAPPPVPGQNRTIPGMPADAENTTTSVAPGMSPGGRPSSAPGPAFGSAPPSFGSPPSTKSGPPPARAGAAPVTRKNPALPDTGTRGGFVTGQGEDPSFASVPDLRVPTPIGWAPPPSGGAPSSDRTSGGSVPSDRSLGGQTLGGATLNTVTRTAFDTVGVGAPPDALGSPLGGPVTPATTEPERSFGDFGDFGALAEPPSMLSLPSASFPSFPSLTGARASEPEPFDPNAFGDLGDLSLASTPSATYDSRATVSSPSPAPSSDEGGFGEIRDLSIVSSPGLPSPVTLPRRGAPGPQASRPGSRIPTPASSEGNFGQIRDLSIVSTSAETQGIDAITEARNQALAGGTFGDGDLAETDENTAAMQRGPGGTIDILPFENPAAGGAGANLAARGEARIDDGADLPAAVATADLPAVARGKAPPTRKAGQLGMGPSGGAAMAGSPPPLMAPQPFGPMERAPDEDDLPSFTAAMPAPAPARPPVPSGRPNAPNAPNAARAAPTQASPVAPPMPAGAAARSRPPPAPPAPPPPFAATLASPARTGAPGGSAPPGPPVTAPMPAQQAQTPRGPGPAPMQPAYMQNTLPAQQAYTGPQGQPGQPGHPGHSAPPAPFLPAPSAAVNAYGASASGPYASPVTHPAGPPGGQPPIAPGSPFGPPPGQSGSGPYASRPPGPPAPTFGVHPSSLPGSPPPAPHAVGVAPPYPSMAPGPGAAPPPTRNIGFAAPVLVDVTPRALVVETAGGYTDTIIPRNAKIPCERTRRFATGRDGQTSVRVRVGQGEHGHFPQNTYLGEVELSGLRPAPRGEVTVAVTFEVDADGTLRIRARDVQTGQEARATLHLQGVADESSVVMMINRFAQQPVTGNGPTGPAS